MRLVGCHLTSFPSRKLRTCLSQNVPFAQCRVGLRLGLAYQKHFLCHAATSSQMLGKQPTSAYIVPHTEYSCKAHREQACKRKPNRRHHSAVRLPDEISEMLDWKNLQIQTFSDFSLNGCHYNPKLYRVRASHLFLLPQNQFISVSRTLHILAYFQNMSIFEKHFPLNDILRKKERGGWLIAIPLAV